jgi:hypothetical protein
MNPISRYGGAVSLAAAMLAAVGTVGAAPAVAAGAGQSRLAAAATPPAGPASQMAYDVATGTDVLFDDGQTWTWNGTAWTQQQPATSPSPRSYASMAYDAATKTVVLFGGSARSGPLNDTWTWNGTTWTQQHPATSPSPRWTGTMAYDAAAHNVVLFGGRGHGGADGDTWIWTGSDWRKRIPVASPPRRMDASMAYDPATHAVILFGGRIVRGDQYYDDTWSWNGTIWTQRHPATIPPANIDLPSAYDEATGTVVLFGDGGQAGGNGTWTWDGSNWAQQSPATSPQWFQRSTSMAYDAPTGTVVLFAADGSTWIWNGTTWTEVPAGSDTVTVTSPGNQSAYRHTGLDLQIQGSSSGGNELTWSATGLPPGLMINSSGFSTALISGKVEAAPGSYPVTVTASDATGGSGQASFTWTVHADVGSAIKNASSGTCLNDYNGLVTDGNPIILWVCRANGPNERFSHPSNPGELVVFGQCLTGPASKVRQVIQPCTGASDQIWNHNSTGEYVLQSSGQCLTDPHGSTGSGTPAEVQACQNLKDQHWNGS